MNGVGLKFVITPHPPDESGRTTYIALSTTDAGVFLGEGYSPTEALVDCMIYLIQHGDLNNLMLETMDWNKP
jgi:hypothetical protein